MTTAARTYDESSARFYTMDGMPFFEVLKADGTGVRNPDIRDARKLGLLPSVTSILKTLDKPELNSWKTEQAILAVLSSPRKEGESLDDFVHRVLHVEKVQDQEARKARELGSDIHDAIQKAITGQPYPAHLLEYVAPVVAWQRSVGNVVWTEKVLVGDGYAGKADALLENETLNLLVLPDFKSTSKLPKKSYPEHRLQTAAYAATLGNTNGRRVITANVYISTKEPGQYVVHTQDDWADTFVNGFEPLLQLWQWMNGMIPAEVKE